MRVVDLNASLRRNKVTIGCSHSKREEIVARDKWETLFPGQGMKNPLPRMRMLDGFNEGWVDSSGNGDLALKEW